jgi:hypothetical protein
MTKLSFCQDCHKIVIYRYFFVVKDRHVDIVDIYNWYGTLAPRRYTYTWEVLLHLMRYIYTSWGTVPYTCLWAYGSGSQCRPNWMHIGSGETQEGSGFWVGGYIGGQWKGGVSLQATWDWGGRFLSQLRGFQVSKRGYKGEEGGVWQGEIKARGMCHV